MDLQKLKKFATIMLSVIKWRGKPLRVIKNFEIKRVDSNAIN